MGCGDLLDPLRSMHLDGITDKQKCAQVSGIIEDLCSGNDQFALVDGDDLPCNMALDRRFELLRQSFIEVLFKIALDPDDPTCHLVDREVIEKICPCASTNIGAQFGLIIQHLPFFYLTCQ